MNLRFPAFQPPFLEPCASPAFVGACARARAVRFFIGPGDVHAVAVEVFCWFHASLGTGFVYKDMEYCHNMMPNAQKF